MTLLRNIAADLVEKRLWPIAAALLLALVAVPVVLARGGGEPQAPAPAPALPAALAAAAADPVVALADSPVVRRRPGRIGDPMFDPTAGRRRAPATTASPPSSTTSASSASSAASTSLAPSASFAPSASPSSSTSTSAGLATATIPGAVETVPTPTGTETTASPTTSTTPTTEATPEPTAPSVDLRVGEPGALKTLREVAELTPLPSEEDPFLVLLSVGDDGGSATFLVSPDATPSGDGTCRPTPEACQRLVLEAGDKEVFDLDPGDGAVRRFELELLRVRGATRGTTAGEAARTRGRHRHATARDRRARARDRRATAPGLGVDLRVGATTRRRLPRLALLPRADAPALLLLGVLSDRRTVALANVFGAPVTGRATCRPTPGNCRVVEAAAGARLRVGDLPVEVLAVRPAARGDDPTGRRFLRAALAAGIAGVDGLRHSPATGTLSRPRRSEGAS